MFEEDYIRIWIVFILVQMVPSSIPLLLRMLSTFMSKQSRYQLWVLAVLVERTLVYDYMLHKVEYEEHPFEKKS